MPIACNMTLNSKAFTALECRGAGNFPVFSGTGAGRDNPADVAMADIGPLPPGRYCIADRQSGGRLGYLRDFLLEHMYGTDRGKWFALYRNDGVIDDFTFVQGVKRGNFRLHPIGPRGLSEGCITLANPMNFDVLRKALLSTKLMDVQGLAERVYGTVDVK